VLSFDNTIDEIPILGITNALEITDSDISSGMDVVQLGRFSLLFVGFFGRKVTL
jgi:hypothetical protein